MTFKTKRMGMMILASAVVALVAVPVTSAQATNFSLTEATVEGSPIQPDIGTARLTVGWQYSTTNAAQTPLTAVQGSITISWVPDCPDNVLVSGSRTTIVTLAAPTPPQTTISQSGEAVFDISVTQEAPGETQLGCTITGTASALQQTTASSPDPSSIDFKVVAKYLGLVSVNVPKTIRGAGPQKEITYDLEVSNLGNSRSNINFRLISENSGGWQPVIPAQIPLESKSQGGTDTSKTVGFTVSTPFKNGWNNKQTTFQLEVQPVSTKTPSTDFGAPVQVTVLARVRGVYVPTLDPVLMVGAVLATAFVLRMARKEE